MGEVRKTLDTRLDRVVALNLSNQDFTKRFERKAHAIGTLNDSNICQLCDVGSIVW